MSGQTGDPAESEALARLAANRLFGREPILAAVRSAISDLHRGNGRSLVLVGEAGIGKTRLANEIARLAELDGARILVARCHELEGAPALWPWIRIVRASLADLESSRRSEFLQGVGGALIELLPELTARTNVAGDRGARSRMDDPERLVDRFLVFEAITSLLRTICAESPLLVVLDDLHWTDPASVLLARYAVRELRDEGVLFVASYRDTDIEASEPLSRALAGLDRESDVYRLGGLEADDLRRLVEHVTARSLPAPALEALMTLTSGIPFYVVEILRSLASENRLGAFEASVPQSVPLPLSVRHVLEARLERLGLSARGVLEQACVLGREFERDVLESALCSETAPGPPLPEQSRPRSRSLGVELDEAVHARLIEPVPDAIGRFRFSHDLIREALDAGLATDRRSRLHRGAATALLETRSGTLEGHYAALSLHLLESASPDTAGEALEHALRGAEHAAASFSYELAAQLFERGLRALDLLSPGSDHSGESLRTRGAILIRIGDVHWQTGRRAEADTAYRDAETIARRLGDPELLARAAIGRSGRDDIPMSSAAPCVDLLREALDGLSASDSRLRVRLLCHLVRATHFGPERARVFGWATDAQAIAERLGDPVSRFSALESLHYAQLLPRQLDARLAASERLLALARQTGIPRFEAVAWLWRCYDLFQKPDVRAADEALNQVVDHAARLRQPYYQWHAHGLQAMRALMRGELGDAERHLSQALEHGNRSRTPNAALAFGTQLFHLRELQGRSGELLPAVGKLVEQNPSMPVFQMMIPMIHMNEHRPDETRETFERVAARDFDDVPHDGHRLPMLMVAATVAAYLGDQRRAAILHRELIEDEGRIAIGGILTYWEGPVDRNLGQLEESLGRLDEAAFHFARAARLCRAGGGLVMEAHCLREQARVLRRRGRPGDREAADRIATRADDFYSSCGIDPAVVVPSPIRGDKGVRSQRAESVVDEHGARLVRRGPRWHAEYAGLAVELPGCKGLAYLHRLLASPGAEIHVLDLVAIEAPEAIEVVSEHPGVRPRSPFVASERAGGSSRVVESSLPMLDVRARRAYQARLRDLARRRSEAERDRDLARLAALDEERGRLEEELSAAFGPGGRARRAADPVERARKAVYNRIRDAIRRIERQHPDLARHLAHSIRTGSACSYRPEAAVVWTTE